MCLAVRVRSSGVLILYRGCRAEGLEVCEEYGAGATHIYHRTRSRVSSVMTTLLYSISDVELSDIIQFCVAGILVRFSILESFSFLVNVRLRVEGLALPLLLLILTAEIPRDNLAFQVDCIRNLVTRC